MFPGFHAIRTQAGKTTFVGHTSLKKMEKWLRAPALFHKNWNIFKAELLHHLIVGFSFTTLPKRFSYVFLKHAKFEGEIFIFFLPYHFQKAKTVDEFFHWLVNLLFCLHFKLTVAPIMVGEAKWACFPELIHFVAGFCKRNLELV